MKKATAPLSSRRHFAALALVALPAMIASKARFLHPTFTFAALALAALLAQPASATALYTADLTNGCFAVGGVGSINSPTPVSASSNCTVPTVISEQGTAAAGPGHVGASLNVDSGICCHSDADAIFSFTVTFTSTTTTAQASVPVSLNLLSAGVLQGSGSFNTSWELFGQLSTLQFSVGGDIDSSAGVQTNINGVTFSGSGQTLNAGVLNVAGGLTTDIVGVPLDTPIFISLHLSLSGFANPGTFDNQFAGSIDFPIGTDVFNLPAGFTVNDPDGIIVNNRFGSAVATVPEPGSMLLLVSALAGLAFIRRRPLRGTKTVDAS